MTSSAVFQLGGAAAGATPAASGYSWSIQHAPPGVGPLGPLGPLGDISRSLPPPEDPWPGAADDGAAWSSSRWQGGLADDPLPFQAGFQDSYRGASHDPFRGQGPYRVQHAFQTSPNRGPFDPSGFREAQPPTPVQWLAPPQPQPSPKAQQPGTLAAHDGDDWQHGPRQWTSPGQGVVSLLPWFLGMTVVSGADTPTDAETTPSRTNLPARPGVNRPVRPGVRPGPARPATRTRLPGPAPAPGGGGGDAPTTQNGRLQELYRWKRVDYDFPDEATRAKAIADGDYNADNNLPLGVETYRDRIFVSIPRWKPGVPATLAYVSRYPNGDASPKLKPYPDWSWHRVPRAGQNDSCQALTSVFRMTADECGRLWVIDSGAVDAIGDIRVVCPPQIVIFDLKTDRLLWRYVIPKSQTKPESLFTNIVVDIRDGQCDDAFAYAADVFRYGLLVYSWREDRSYRLSHNLFFPDPIASRFVLDNVTFRWMDGIFGLALSPLDKKTQDRTMFFHPMASFREFAVQTSVIRNETYANDHPDDFRILGVRGRNQSHSSASAMDRRGVLFFNLVTQDALGCWDSAKPYGRATVGHVAQDHALLNFPNDLKVDREEPQNIWMLTNRLHLYLYRSLSPDEYNFRILTGTVEKATDGTICDPRKTGAATSVPRDVDACDDL